MSAMSDLYIDITDLIVEGLNNREISKRLCVETSWVESVRKDMEADSLSKGIYEQI